MPAVSIAIGQILWCILSDFHRSFPPLFTPALQLSAKLDAEASLAAL